MAKGHSYCQSCRVCRILACMTASIDDARDPKRLANSLIGERVHTLMWRRGHTQRQLAAILGVDQGSISNRLHGKTTWSAIEVVAVATWLDEPVTDLLAGLPGGPGPDPGPGGGRSTDKPVGLSTRLAA